MKKTILLSTLLISSSFSFDFKSLASDISKNIQKNETISTKSSLDNTTISSGLKEALKKGVEFATTELGKENGYLNNLNVKIPLPQNLQSIENIVRKAGGDKIVDDLINSMNKAASDAAIKTTTIFLNSIEKMSLEDANKILNGGEDAATQYFKKDTTSSLKELIKPIIQETLKNNSVAQYYDSFNSFYKNNASNLLNSSTTLGIGKKLGFDLSNNSEDLDDFVTTKAIDGLFYMIGEKEAAIRANPIEQTSSILKEVFGK